MNKSRLLSTVYVFCLVGFSGAQAGDAPTTGMLYNIKETHSIVFRCQQNSSNILDCKFTQIAVRKKAKPEDLSATLGRARESFKSGEKTSTEDCKMASELVDILEGRKKPPREQGLSEITDIQKADHLKEMKAMKILCKSNKEEDFLNLVRLGHEKNLRTCLVSSNSFTQSFKLVQDAFSGIGTWVAQGDAEGPCGIVQLTRFEPEKLEISSHVVWKYIARKAVTNPNGVLFPGTLCKNLDETEYTYDWRSKEYSLGCDYLEFSPI